MAHFSSPKWLTAAAVAVVMMSCTKESDSVAPAAPAAAAAHQFGMEPVGSTWVQGADVTGLCQDLLMTKVSANITGNEGEIAKWTAQTTCPVAARTTNDITATNHYGQTFRYKTTIQTTGEVTMLTFYLPSQQ